VAVFWLTHGGFDLVRTRLADTINELIGWFR